MLFFTIEFQSKQTFGQDDDYIVKNDPSFRTTLSNILVILDMTKLLIVWTPIISL
jgi:hypothetical protein